MNKARLQLSVLAGALFALAAMFTPIESRAQESTTISLSVKNHAFQPAQVHGPANKPITLRVRNLDAIAMEFESVSLRVEKVVAPNSEGTINIRPLAPGMYEFFDDFHQETRGTLIVQ